MARYPRTARDAALKCISCNAPVIQTVDDRYVCVECGESPITPTSVADTTPTAADD
ncbi:hypothetical protein M0R88_10440 [Halorussus gelatinilyticus]|uniref:Uncharacterized protein n=1 Tax=Halorussus gelatinilyticus TaxID=2937524 RepID=A0A8U0ID17_9EURY|nr:hypothetical protein [Halorussus gelatinilyticus]UPV98946.1 hypothetical protein M0R88_10440 [Halorussus gelatinilyticus]